MMLTYRLRDFYSLSMILHRHFHFSVIIKFWFLFFKQKTAYEMRISDWSSDVCSSDLPGQRVLERLLERQEFEHAFGDARVKADSALVWPDGIVVLDAPAALDADIDRKSTRLNSSH